MRILVAGVGLLVLVGAGRANADVLDKPAFTATPAELLAAAKSAAGADASVVMLRDDVSIRFDEHGRAERRHRLVFTITKPAGVDDWGEILLHWSPFYQDQPVIKARVIAPDGSSADFDPSLISDAPMTQESPSVFSDRRTMSVPLPRLVVGAVVEEAFVIKDREPLLEAGVIDDVPAGRDVPVTHAVITIDAPTARGIHVVTRGFAKPPTPSQVVRAGRTTWTYVLGPQPALEPSEAGFPGDVAGEAYIGISTGASWAAVATDYQRLVDEKLKDAIALPAGIKPEASRATVDALVAWLHAHVRYTGIELSQSAIVPFAPSATASRGFGDCKDKATLLVALLRAAGVHADLALLSTGPGPDVVRALPGMGDFDHAIVRARLGGKDLWIDATESDLPAGQLPARDQGRLALVIAAGTRDLVMTPVAPSTDNLIREVRTYHLAERDHGSATEVTEQHGVFWDDQRAWFRDTSRADLTKSLSRYATDVYGGSLTSFSSNAPIDVTQPFVLTVEVGDVARADADREQITLRLFRSSVFGHLPDTFNDDDATIEARIKERHVDYVWWTPHVYEVENRLELPPGFSPPPLVAREQRAFGTMTLSTTRRLDGNTVVITYRLDTGKRRITADELRATRAAVLAFRAENGELVTIAQTGAALVHAGKIKEAIAEFQRLIALHPTEALHHDQLAMAYGQAGMGAAARREARRATEVEPTSGDAFSILAFHLRRDTLGRMHGFDADRVGALAAYRRALALKPDHLGAHLDLASLLVSDERGRPILDAAANLEAVTHLQRAKEISKSGEYDQRLTLALWFAGKSAEAEAAARTLPASDFATGLQIAIVGAARGAPDAVALARSLVAGPKLDAALGAAAGLSIMTRRYDLARAFAAEVPHDGAPDPTIAALAPIDVDRMAASDPLRPVIAMLAGTDEVAVARPPWDATLGAEIAGISHQVARGGSAHPGGFSPAIVLDMDVAGLAPKVEGDARDGWRVEVGGGRHRMAYYVISDHGRATLVGAVGLTSGVGRYVLARLAKKDEQVARRWLQRLSDDSPPSPSVIDVVAANDARMAIAMYRDEARRAGAQPLSRDVLELTAAMLVIDHDRKLAEPIVRRCAVKSELAQRVCQATLVHVLRAEARDAEAEPFAQALLAHDPQDHSLIIQHALILAHAGRFDDAAAALDAALAAEPDDLELLRARTEVAMGAPRWSDAGPWLEKLVKHPHHNEIDLNQVSWARLFFDADLTTTRALGAEAERLGGTPDPELANTLAAIAAESDQPYSAWTHLQQSLPGRVDQAPTGADWYVVGRIAESYGLRDDAIAAYRRVTKPGGGDLLPSSYDFAQRNLKRLGAH